MVKSQIRKEYLEKRRKLSEDQIKVLSKKIADNLIGKLPTQIRAAHIYLPILEKNEIDTWQIIHLLWERGIDVAVPVMSGEGISMQSCLLSKETALQNNRWSIPEPVERIGVEDRRIDVVFLPLLAFDTSGYRVGYGKGYYDRFLQNVTDKALKIGLSFFPPLDQSIEKDSWDIPMDVCITPDGTYQFNQ